MDYDKCPARPNIGLVGLTDKVVTKRFIAPPPSRFGAQLLPQERAAFDFQLSYQLLEHLFCLCGRR
jgi:hypothetical protein